MANSHDVNQAFAVCYPVHDPPLSDTHAPNICCALQLYDPSGAGSPG